jgi:hypothetical protein
MKSAYDPTSENSYDAVRKRVLAQQGMAEPSAALGGGTAVTTGGDQLAPAEFAAAEPDQNYTGGSSTFDESGGHAIATPPLGLVGPGGPVTNANQLINIGQGGQGAPDSTYGETGGMPQDTSTAAPAAPSAISWGTGDPMQDWLGFIQHATGGQVASRGGSQGGFITGGGAALGKLQPFVDQYNATYGRKATVVGDDKIDFNDGRGPIDVITSDGDFWYGGAAGTGGGAGGYGTGTAAPAGASTAAPAPAAAATSTAAPSASAVQSPNAVTAAAGGGSTSASAGTAGSAPSDWQQQVRAILMQRLAAAGRPVDANSPEIAGAVTAARDEATRATDTERTALAERLYAQGGLNSNELNQGIQQSSERNAQNIGGLRASLIMQEYGKRRQELDSLLQTATASGDAESARQVQMEMAALDATLKREGFGIDLAKYSAYLNQNAALAGLNG